jgi:hypothetical protein
VTTGRGLANITAIWGVWMDNDGGDLSADEFAAMFPHLMMVIHNSASSTPDAPRWRAIIPTTCAVTIEVHREIMSQLRQALNRRGYFDKRQIAKRREKGLSGRFHGFDRWRCALPGDGNSAFFRLGVDLDRAGMSPAEIDSVLRQEAGYGRSPTERRAQIKYIMRSLRGSPYRMAA